jgi:uncharacterized SAM-binding protein YcdF (DUF218 family)
MDQGINAIILILVTLSISLFVFIFLFEGLILVFILISITLIPLLAYTCLVVITTRWTKYTVMKEWDEYEEIKKIQPPFIE